MDKNSAEALRSAAPGIGSIPGEDIRHLRQRWRTYRKKMAHIPGGGQIGFSWNLCRGLGFVPLLIKQRIDASM